MKRKKLEEDLEIVEDALRYLNKHQKENFRIIEPNYLQPRALHIIMPMNHPQGLFMYYREISNVLYLALKKGKVSKSIMPKNPPNYLEELAA